MRLAAVTLHRRRCTTDRRVLTYLARLRATHSSRPADRAWGIGDNIFEPWDWNPKDMLIFGGQKSRTRPRCWHWEVTLAALWRTWTAASQSGCWRAWGAADFLLAEGSRTVRVWSGGSAGLGFTMSLHPPAPKQQTQTVTQTAPGSRSKVNVKKAVRSSQSFPLGLVWLLVFAFPVCEQGYCLHKEHRGVDDDTRAVFIVCALMWFGCFPLRVAAALFSQATVASCFCAAVVEQVCRQQRRCTSGSRPGAAAMIDFDRRCNRRCEGGPFQSLWNVQTLKTLKYEIWIDKLWLSSQWLAEFSTQTFLIKKKKSALGVSNEWKHCFFSPGFF